MEKFVRMGMMPMGFDRAVQSAIVRVDMMLCAAVPVVIALLIFGSAALIIIKSTKGGGINGGKNR